MSATTAMKANSVRNSAIQQFFADKANLILCKQIVSALLFCQQFFCRRQQNNIHGSRTKYGTNRLHKYYVITKTNLRSFDAARLQEYLVNCTRYSSLRYLVAQSLYTLYTVHGVVVPRVQYWSTWYSSSQGEGTRRRRREAKQRRTIALLCTVYICSRFSLQFCVIGKPYRHLRDTDNRGANGTTSDRGYLEYESS